MFLRECKGGGFTLHGLAYRLSSLARKTRRGNLMSNLWMVRSQKGLLYDKFIENDAILLGWSQVGALSEYETRDDVFQKLLKTFPDRKTQTNRVHASILYRFAKEFAVGDKIITYHPGRRKYRLGTIVREYQFDGSIDQEYPNVRAVNWEQEVDRDELTQKTKYQLGSTISLFSIGPDTRDEILSLGSKGSLAEPIEGQKLGFVDEEEFEDDLQEQSIELIKDKINQLGWEELQDLVAGLLRSLGYKTKVSDKGPDRGRDIMASPDGFGFTPPRIVVEVKHRKDTIGAPDIRSFLGGRHSDDRGLYVSTGGFTKEAVYEAERANIPLDLMDIDRLAESVVEQYAEFDIETQQLLPLKRLYWPA
jgi:restriction system protein